MAKEGRGRKRSAREFECWGTLDSFREGNNPTSKGEIPMLTPTHRVAKCAAMAAMKEYKNPHNVEVVQKKKNPRRLRVGEYCIVLYSIRSYV